jgi:hypothetical protein
MQPSAPDDGRTHRSKHVELTWNKKLIHIVRIVGYFHSSNYESVRQVPAIAEHTLRNSGEVPTLRSGVQLVREARRFNSR